MEVEDHCKGFHPTEGNTGNGLVDMRERAEILGGRLSVAAIATGGTLLHLEVPRERLDAHVE